MEKSLYFEFDNIKIYNHNIIESTFEDKSVDLIVTSPPYNVDIQYSSNDDKLVYEDYLKFTEQ